MVFIEAAKRGLIQPGRQDVSPRYALDELAQSSDIRTATDIHALCDQQQIIPTQAEIQRVFQQLPQLGTVQYSPDTLEIISPRVYRSFDTLKAEQLRIQQLQLVPKRPDFIQKEYMQIKKTTFLSLVSDYYLRTSPLSLVTELFPTDLPSDVRQSVVWTREGEVNDQDIAHFIAQILKLLGLTENDIILFERSRESMADFVRVAIPEHRHIHMWTRHEEIRK